ncbi:MAG TPA: cytidylate kinase-like family protein [Bacteroidales bacterium]|nr:cytidylate kinase-like family protein [Bacteroidales bacterium]
MSSVFNEYLRRMHHMAEDEPSGEGHLPFITISRQAGCHSYTIARLVQQMLNTHARPKWQLVTKEILSDASHEMNLKSAQVKGILEGDKRSHLSEILQSIENHTYLSDNLVRKKLAEFIESAALRGHVIIVGRAGAMITARVPGGLHIRLVAPLEWRATNVMSRQNIGRKEAMKWIEETDIRRKRLLEAFSGKPLNELIFDLQINNASFTNEEIAASIVSLITKRYST